VPEDNSDLDNSVRLTQYSRSGGCGCKVSSSTLREMLHGLSAGESSGKLIAGLAAYDDAAVMRLNNDLALILTIDAFTPLFDNPEIFGRVAAANAASDVYAMGGKPILAQAFLGWPVEHLSSKIARRVLEGAISMCSSMGIEYAGGHTISSVEPIFGLCVNGLCKIANIKRNSTARQGDLLYLSKPIGSGILSTAEKKGLLKAKDRQLALDVICAPNKLGEVMGGHHFVSAMTDITGFGLAGHVYEMASLSGLCAVLDTSRVRFLNAIDEYLALGCATTGGERNRLSFSRHIDFKQTTFQDKFYDPQTNGGLLIACEQSRQSEFEHLLVENGFGAFAEPIGFFEPSDSSKPTVTVI
jgi:selenide,water dikinase